MQRFKLTLEYDGTEFAGWQYQNNARSVQGELEAALASLLQETVRVHGAGRTDAGVHAAGMTAHFDSNTALPPAVIRKGVNAILPADVAVSSAEPVRDDFHARFSASSRSYRYRIDRKKRPLGRSYTWVHYGALDAGAIGAAVPLVRGTHDFSALSKRTEADGHKYCHVFNADWRQDDDMCEFTITANRFLYGMVRCLVGAFIQIGRGVLTGEEFTDIFASRDPANAPMLAPASGLTLTEVRYDPEERRIVQEIMDRLKQELPIEDEHE